MSGDAVRPDLAVVCMRAVVATGVVAISRARSLAITMVGSFEDRMRGASNVAIPTPRIVFFESTSASVVVMLRSGSKQKTNSSVACATAHRLAAHMRNPQCLVVDRRAFDAA
jgi:hypothetical protein